MTINSNIMIDKNLVLENEIESLDGDFDIEKELSEIYKEMAEIEILSNKNKESILEEIKKILSPEEFEDILYSIEESENTDNYRILEKPLGTFQKESTFQKLEGQFVNQTINGGYLGDEFAGSVSIKISDNKYFTFDYFN